MVQKSHILRTILPVLLLTVAGCATYHQPRYGSDGVYYDDPRVVYRPVAVISPVYYPYWSLDYFYFSRFYHPYSVFVHPWDPWYYPYPGWFYGYHPGPRTRARLSVHVGGFYPGFYYPWSSFGFLYARYRPWQAAPVPVAPGQPRVREIDQRLREMQRRDARAARPPVPGHATVDRIPTRFGDRSTETRHMTGPAYSPGTRRISRPETFPERTRSPAPSQQRLPGRTEPAQTRPQPREQVRERSRPEPQTRSSPRRSEPRQQRQPPSGQQSREPSRQAPVRERYRDR